MICIISSCYWSTFYTSAAFTLMTGIIIFYLSCYFSTHTRLNGNLYAYFDKRSYKMCRAARRSSSSKEIQKKKRHSERASSEICSRQYTHPCGNQAHPLFACSNLVRFVEHIFFYFNFISYLLFIIFLVYRWPYVALFIKKLVTSALMHVPNGP